MILNLGGNGTTECSEEDRGVQPGVLRSTEVDRGSMAAPRSDSMNERLGSRTASNCTALVSDKEFSSSLLERPAED